MQQPHRLAYTVDELVAASGVSRSVIYEHVEAGRLTFRYPSARPVVLRDEAEAWLASLPSERPKKKRAKTKQGRAA